MHVHVIDLMFYLIEVTIHKSNVIYSTLHVIQLFLFVFTHRINLKHCFSEQNLLHFRCKKTARIHQYTMTIYRFLLLYDFDNSAIVKLLNVDFN
eukprot:UN30010